MKKLGLVLLVATQVCAARGDDLKLPEPALDPAVAAPLDALVAKNDWNGVGAALAPANNDPARFLKTMDWLKVRVDEGGPYFLALLYSRDLWVAAGGSFITSDLRNTSAMMLLYTMALIRVDGPACGDPTAPTHRFDQAIQLRGATFQYLKTLPEKDKAILVALAARLERYTAPLRHPHDEMLCRDGMEETMAGVKAGLTKEVPPQPGQVGHTIAVGTPPGWTPSYRPEAEYKPKQDEARATLNEWLTNLVK